MPPTVPDLVDALRPLVDGALIATDFDGTLAPLQTDPEASRPVAGAVDALRDLARAGARIAVVTGRDARTVVRLGGLDRVPGIVVAGVYGAELWRAGELTSPDTPDAIRVLRHRLPGALVAADADPAVWIEDKRLSLVVHARRADDPRAALAAVEAPVSALAAELGLEAHPGSGVLELRLPGFDKGGVLERLVTDLAPRAVLFLGDDLGDVAGFEAIGALRERGLPAWGVAVASSGVPAALEAADVAVPDAQAAAALLGSLLP